MTSDYDFYSMAHLVVAAIRVLEHQSGQPATVEGVCRKLSFSLDRVGFVCHRLEKLGVIERPAGAHGDRLFIKDHLRIEQIDRTETESQLDRELKRFQDSRSRLEEKINSLRKKQARQKKDLFADLENRLKKELHGDS
jgi:hypothetical protein